MTEYDWSELGSTNLLPAGKQLAEPELLFEKIEDDAIEAQLRKLEETKKANEEAAYKAEPIKKEIPFDDFEKLDIRVGHIIKCEKVKKSKSYCSSLSTMDQVLNAPSSVVLQPTMSQNSSLARDVLFVANFAPRKMMGIESQGMILSAVNFDGSLAVTTTLDKVKPGSQVG